MARLIDANALIERLKFKRRLNGNIPDKCAGYDSAIAQANKLPSVDPVHAAGACYCWECRFADIGGNGVESWRYCKVKYRNIYPTDFCSYGQRREDTKRKF